MQMRRSLYPANSRLTSDTLLVISDSPCGPKMAGDIGQSGPTDRSACWLVFRLNAVLAELVPQLFNLAAPVRRQPGLFLRQHHNPPRSVNRSNISRPPALPAMTVQR
jgi:hypothetical protein